MCRTFALLALAAGSACSESRKQPSPLGPSPTPSVSSVSQQSLYGYVADTAFSAIAGARIEVVDGPQAGMSMVSDAGGLFSYIGTFTTPVTFRISRDGYITTTETSRVSAPNGRPWVYVRLEAVGTPVDIAGEYTLTLTADGACTGIPDQWRTRTYAATITPRADPAFRPNTLLTLTVGGATWLPGHADFEIGVSGANVGFTIYQGEDFGLVDQVEPGTFLAYQGGASVSLEGSSASTIAATVNGVIDYCAMAPGSTWNYSCSSARTIAHATCESRNHQLILTRR